MSIKFHFVVGVEGTGHHMIGAILSEHIKRDDSVFEGEWHKLLAERWDCKLRFKHNNQLLSFSREKDFREALRRSFKKYADQQVSHLFEHTSFPYEQPREPLRRPDIIEFSELMEEFKDFIDVKYLVLYRNPVAATYSAIRRKFTDNVYLQARIAESNFIYVERQISQIPDEKYRTVHFEDFLNDSEHYGKKLADWWDLDYPTVVQGLRKLRKPSGLAKIPEDARAFLEDFFNERRVSQWKEFYRRNSL